MKKNLLLLLSVSITVFSCKEDKKDELYFIEMKADKLQLDGSFKPEITVDTIWAKGGLEAYKKGLLVASGVDQAARLINKRNGINKSKGVHYFKVVDNFEISVTKEIELSKLDSINNSISLILPEEVRPVINKYSY